MTLELLTHAERRDLLSLVVKTCYTEPLSDTPLLPAIVRDNVETLELMLGGYELDSLCLPPTVRIEMEGLLDAFAGEVIRRR